MNELEARSGTPRSTIHFYIQEGLLPEPQKPTLNSAIYSEEHLYLLRELQQLRTPPLGPLPLSMMKRVADRIRNGLSARMALSLERAVAGVVDPKALGKRLTAKDVCSAAGVSMKMLRELVDSGLIVRDPTDGKLDTMDVELTKVYDELFRESGITVGDSKPIVFRQLADLF